MTQYFWHGPQVTKGTTDRQNSVFQMQLVNPWGASAFFSFALAVGGWVDSALKFPSQLYISITKFLTARRMRFITLHPPFGMALTHLFLHLADTITTFLHMKVKQRISKFIP